MLDIQLLRDDPNSVAQHLASRGYILDVTQFNALEQQRKILQTQTQEIQNKRNARSKDIGIAKSKGESVDLIMAEVANLADDLKAKEQGLLALQQQIQNILLEIPNLPHSSVPVGKNEANNVEVRQWGTLAKV
jgi:Seryl-tRNA synthetase